MGTLNLRQHLIDFLNNMQLDKVECVCLTNKIDNYKLDELKQEFKIVKYKIRVKEYTFILSADTKEDKYNLEVISPNEPNFIYQVPFVISDNSLQDQLKQLFLNITKIQFHINNELNSFLNSFDWNSP